jgi:hypothetical protein
MSTLEQALGGPLIEVVAKATRRRFTVEYKRKIVREADAFKTPGAVGALLRREGCTRPSDDVARGAGAGRTGRGAEEAGARPARSVTSGRRWAEIIQRPDEIERWYVLETLKEMGGALPPPRDARATAEPSPVVEEDHRVLGA